MPFKTDDYIYYGSDGLCRIDDICENPFEGAPAGVCYYVMHTLSEPRQTIWNPKGNERVLMRAVMTVDEIEELFSCIPSLDPFSAPNAKLLREQYLRSIKSGLPIEWGRVMRTYQERKRAERERLVRVTEAERGFYENARHLLSDEIALVTGKEPHEIEATLDALAG